MLYLDEYLHRHYEDTEETTTRFLLGYKVVVMYLSLYNYDDILTVREIQSPSFL